MRPYYERVILEDRPEYKAIEEIVEKAAARDAAALSTGLLKEDGREILIDVLGARWQPDTSELPEDWDPRQFAIGNEGVATLYRALQEGEFPKTRALFTGAIKRSLVRSLVPNTSALRDVFMSTKVDMLSAWDPGEDWISLGYRGHSSLIYNLNQLVALYMEDYGRNHSLTFNFTETQDVREAAAVAGDRAIRESLESYAAKFLELFFARLANYVDLTDAVIDPRKSRWKDEWSQVLRYGDAGRLSEARDELLAYVGIGRKSKKGPGLSGLLPEDWDPRFKGRDPRLAREQIKSYLEAQGLLEDATIWNKELRYERGKIGYPGTPITMKVIGRLRYMFDHPVEFKQWLSVWDELLESLGYTWGRNGTFKGHIEIDEIDRPTNTGWSR